MGPFSTFNSTFEQAKEYRKYSEITLWISTILLGSNLVINTYFTESIRLSEFIIGINCTFIIGFAVLTFITDYVFFNASVNKRSDFIDNSFGTSYSISNTKNYFTNENISTGIYKMAVNGFENSLFSYNISKQMLPSLWAKTILFDILILLFAIIGFNNAFILLIQLTLPILLLQRAINHTIFVSRINRVHENYRRLFNDLKNENTRSNRIPAIIFNVLEYESTLVYGAVLLDTKVYSKLNSSLSRKWNAIKRDYNIE